MCVQVRLTERGGGERRQCQRDTCRRGTFGEGKKRSVREGKPARSGGDDVDDGNWMMDESSTVLHRRKEKSVCVCVCVCVHVRERKKEVGRAKGHGVGGTFGPGKEKRREACTRREAQQWEAGTKRRR